MEAAPLPGGDHIIVLGKSSSNNDMAIQMVSLCLDKQQSMGILKDVYPSTFGSSSGVCCWVKVKLFEMLGVDAARYSSCPKDICMCTMRR